MYVKTMLLKIIVNSTKCQFFSLICDTITVIIFDLINKSQGNGRYKGVPPALCGLDFFVNIL